MASHKENKFGLKRYIPADIRAQIRRESHFGCVICGCLLVDYEHIEPEFNNAKEHNPEHMTLLCPDCHNRVTRKLISKKDVWKAKQNPQANKTKQVHDLLHIDTNDLEILIGNSKAKQCNIILTLYGKPIIWFEPPIEPDEPSKICAIFYNADGKIHSAINRNQISISTSSFDVQSTSTNIKIKHDNKTSLELSREGGVPLKISRMIFRYLNCSISIDEFGKIIVNQGKSSFTLSKFHIENCKSAISVGKIHSHNKYNKIWLAAKLAITPSECEIVNHRNTLTGWQLSNELINTSYEVVGYVHNGQAHNLLDEFIGKIQGGYIFISDNSLPSGEPIYASKNTKIFYLSQSDTKYDVSFRLFG